MKPAITAQSVLVIAAKQKLEQKKKKTLIADTIDMDKNQYPVYPEDDGYDTPKNPYSPV